MLECQQKTEKEDIVICKKLVEKTGFEDYKILIKDCEHCKKNEEQFLKLQVRNYHLRIISIKKSEINTDESVKYFRNKKESSLFLLTNMTIQRCSIPEIMRGDNYSYFIKNVRKINFEEINDILEDEEKIYQNWKSLWAKNIFQAGDKKKQMEASFKYSFSMLSIRIDFFTRFIEEEKSSFSEDFLSSLDKTYKQYEENLEKRKNNKDFKPVIKVSLMDKIKGAKNAFKRYKDFSKNKGEETVWVSEREAIERQVCCSKCTDGQTCPYCGCQIKKSWFLPLGKSELKTEGCPNQDTYPHLKRFPPKNYWKVCEQKLSIVFFYKKGNTLEMSRILSKLKNNATGDIEIIVGIKPDMFIPRIDNDVIFVKGAKDIEELRDKAQGDYIFSLEDCNYKDFGYDTKLKYEHL